MSLIVVDEEFWRGAARIHDMADELLDIINLYGKAINELTLKGICDISVNNVLVDKAAKLTGYAYSLSNISESIVNLTNDFIKDIDEADSYLYD